MLKGYFVLGGPQLPRELPCFEGHMKGNHVGSRNRGQWLLDYDLTEHSLHIPSRDKRLHLLSNVDNGAFYTSMETLDSSYGDVNYRAKLQTIQSKLDGAFVGVVNNVSTSTHGSLAIITNETRLHFYGLHDTQLETSYLMWTTDDSLLNKVLDDTPLRYLLYRMPSVCWTSVFLPGEVICSRWWRLLKNHSSHLYAYNALERKLFS